jgi:hypothetical protein
LAMDEEALKGFKQRVRDGDLYLNFRRNPFIAVGKANNNKQWHEGEDNRENRLSNNNEGRKSNINIKKENTIVEAMNNLKNKYDKNNFDKLLTRQPK